MQPPRLDRPLRVILADDHTLVRAGLRKLLNASPAIEVVAEADDGQALVLLAQQLEPDVVVTDLSMPVMDGLAAARAIRQAVPRARILVLSMHDSAEQVRMAVSAGADGYLMKASSFQELETAVCQVVERGSYFSPGISSLMLQPGEPLPQDELTPRQLEILTRLAQGRASKEIAFELGLSHKTINAHRAQIMERLGINDLAGLTLYAVRKGLVQP